MERDGFCRSVRSKLNYFLPRDTKGQEKKSCVRLPRIPGWDILYMPFEPVRNRFHFPPDITIVATRVSLINIRLLPFQHQITSDVYITAKQAKGFYIALCYQQKSPC